jgi:phosphoribosylamine--glycine ligase
MELAGAGRDMRILVVGGGGREHALVWALAASPLADKIYCAPGNAGIAETAECVPIGAEDVDALVAFARAQAIDFVVVGPEAPLVLGLVDRLEAGGIKAFGPSAAAAALEGSKGFMKDFAARHDIPSAAYERFTEPAKAKAYVRERGIPIVVKADGLAAGKGVVVAATLAEAEAAIDAALVTGQFGRAGAALVIEEFLVGEEASVLALVDGSHFLTLPSAQDHKAACDGDRGPNTGGMGAYSPAPLITPRLQQEIEATILAPAVAAMAAEGRPFKGILYAGLMIGEAGPKLLEFNVRFGDPECQALLVRLTSDLLPALIAARDGELKYFDLRWRAEPSLTVVMAAKGYPGAYAQGSEIRNLAAAGAVEGVTIFHAATARKEGRLVAVGGRVLGVTAPIVPSISSTGPAASAAATSAGGHSEAERAIMAEQREYRS